MKKRNFPVFWCIYGALVVIALIAIQIAMGQLNVYLARYEASQPKHAANEVFEANFADFDPIAYLERFDDSIFGLETRENVAAYLSEKTKGTEFSYYSVSSSESGVYKYAVKSDNVKIAEFTLVECDGEDGFKSYKEGEFSIYFAANEDVEVTVPRGSVVTLNGKNLDESYIIENDIPDEHNAFLFDGVAGVYYTKYKVGGLVASPKIEAKLKDVALSLVETDNGYEAVREYNEALKAEHSEYVLSALQNYATYIQGRYSDGGVSLGSVISYFDPTSKVYATVKNVSNKYVNSYDSYEFRNEKADEFIQYDENTFSCRVSFSQVLHLKGAEDYIDNIDYTLYLRKVGDKFLIYDMERN